MKAQAAAVLVLAAFVAAVYAEVEETKQQEQVEKQPEKRGISSFGFDGSANLGLQSSFKNIELPNVVSLSNEKNVVVPLAVKLPARVLKPLTVQMTKPLTVVVQNGASHQVKKRYPVSVKVPTKISIPKPVSYTPLQVVPFASNNVPNSAKLQFPTRKPGPVFVRGLTDHGVVHGSVQQQNTLSVGSGHMFGSSVGNYISSSSQNGLTYGTGGSALAQKLTVGFANHGSAPGLNSAQSATPFLHGLSGPNNQGSPGHSGSAQSFLSAGHNTASLGSIGSGFINNVGFSGYGDAGHSSGSTAHGAPLASGTTNSGHNFATNIQNLGTLHGSFITGHGGVNSLSGSSGSNNHGPSFTGISSAHSALSPGNQGHTTASGGSTSIHNDGYSSILDLQAIQHGSSGSNNIQGTQNNVGSGYSSLNEVKNLPILGVGGYGLSHGSSLSAPNAGVNQVALNTGHGTSGLFSIPSGSGHHLGSTVQTPSGHISSTSGNGGFATSASPSHNFGSFSNTGSVSAGHNNPAHVTGTSTPNQVLANHGHSGLSFVPSLQSFSHNLGTLPFNTGTGHGYSSGDQSSQSLNSGVSGPNSNVAQGNINSGHILFNPGHAGLTLGSAVQGSNHNVGPSANIVSVHGYDNRGHGGQTLRPGAFGTNHIPELNQLLSSHGSSSSGVSSGVASSSYNVASSSGNTGSGQGPVGTVHSGFGPAGSLTSSHNLASNNVIYGQNSANLGHGGVVLNSGSQTTSHTLGSFSGSSGGSQQSSSGHHGGLSHSAGPSSQNLGGGIFINNHGSFPSTQGNNGPHSVPAVRNHNQGSGNWNTGHISSNIIHSGATHSSGGPTYAHSQNSGHGSFTSGHGSVTLFSKPPPLSHSGGASSGPGRGHFGGNSNTNGHRSGAGRQ